MNETSLSMKFSLAHYSLQNLIDISKIRQF